MTIYADQPIRNRAEDALHRLDFAKHIATGMLKWKSKDNLCIALYGSWGSGKTSIINLCLEEIKEQTSELPPQDRPIIVRFQPWLISGQEQLIKSFLNQLRSALKKPNLSKYAHQAAEQLEVYEKLLGYASWIPSVGEYAEKAEKILSELRTTAKTLTTQLEGDLETNKESICSALSKLSSPVIIIIDDVDRLTSDEIRQLFQLIKAVADFPNTIYLLAFDHMHVEKALEPFQAGSDTRYLEKIVQLNFEVPNPSRSQLAEVLWESLDPISKTVSLDKDEQHRWNNLRFGPLPALFRNVRDVKRYLNTVNFIFPIMKEEISTVDLLIIEAIHVFAPSLYRTIRDNKDYLVSDSSRAMLYSIDNKERNKWVETLPQLAPHYCRDEMKEMLSYLFPEVESVLKNFIRGRDFLTIWAKNQRICMSSCFDYYFQVTLPEGEVSARETSRIIDLLGNKNELLRILKNYMADGRIVKLLPKLETHFEDNADEHNLLKLVVSLFESGEVLHPTPHRMFELPIDWAIDGTIYRLLKKLDSRVRKRVLVAAIESSKNAIVFPVSITNYIWEEWNIIDGKESKKADKEKLLSKEESEEIKDATLTLIRKHKTSDIFYKARHLIYILYNWERWSSTEEVREWVETILSDEKKIPEFLGGCGGFTSRSGLGSHYAEYKFEINPKHLEKFCNVDQLKKKCEQLLDSSPEWFTKDYRGMMVAFLDGFKRDQEDED